MASELDLRKPVIFGTLVSLEPRSCWPDEARDLTPWIASEAGLKLLGEALDLDLACESCEVPVGPFSADILARDLSNSSLVVIENQLERTNHDHFGKTLTYAAVLGASTVVWIAKSFTDEHRKAVDWLNELTNGSLQFYGVQLQVWQIGTSAPAPRFEVVCGPNEVVLETARVREGGETSGVKQLQYEFWTEVKKALQASGEFHTLRAARPQYWFDIAVGRTDVRIALVADTYGRTVGVRLYMGHRVAHRVLEALLPLRETIDQEVGATLDWNPHPEKMDKIIRLNRPGDISDKAQWPELATWLARYAAGFKNAFAPRLLTMNFSASVDTTQV